VIFASSPNPPFRFGQRQALEVSNWQQAAGQGREYPENGYAWHFCKLLHFPAPRLLFTEGRSAL
jgi:hypothetical protein